MVRAKKQNVAGRGGYGLQRGPYSEPWAVAIGPLPARCASAAFPPQSIGPMLLASRGHVARLMGWSARVQERLSATMSSA
jgi:hypothetical protein